MGNGTPETRATPVKAGKQGENPIRCRVWPGVIVDEPSISGSYEPVSGSLEQGRKFAAQGAESIYQGANRRGRRALPAAALDRWAGGTISSFRPRCGREPDH
jgi:hypothetical protein